MASKGPSVRVAADLSVNGLKKLQTGDVRGSKECFAKAVSLEPNSSGHRLCLAFAHKALAEYGAAAEQLTEALRINPDYTAAAEQLGALAASGLIPANARLNVLGLKAALHQDRFDRDLVAETAVRYLAHAGPLKTALERGRAGSWLEAARSLCLKKTRDLLLDDLFIKAIGDNVIRMPELEFLLTALRKVILLELSADRFEDRHLVAFIISLVRQCWINEYVWAVSELEHAHLERVSATPRQLEKGSPAESMKALIEALYKPISDVVSPAPSEAVLAGIKPKAVRDLISEHFAAQREESDHAHRLPKAAQLIDATSRKVASQYAEHPYPRWNCPPQFMNEQEGRTMLAHHFGPGTSRFMDMPFDVLIAGCGTGRQAMASAAAYGPNARVLAIDLSLPSLAYAARMAKRFGLKNISFCQMDIQELATNPDFASRFQVIECVGVLHHMADTFAGWRSLLTCLADDGIMLIGLYSAIGRRTWMSWKADPAYPGAGCGDDGLRGFRQYLMAKPETETGTEFKSVRDLYTMSGFRDLLFNVNEHNHSVPEISTFLSKSGLVFRGFHNQPQHFERFRGRFPEQVWPGTLDRWAEFETENHSAFSGMYVFWCERGTSAGRAS